MYFLIPAEQDLQTAFEACLDHVRPLAVAAGGEAAIAVHSKHNVRGSAIQNVFGDRDTNRLLRGSVQRAGVLWHLITERRRSSFKRGPIVVAYVSPRFLEAVAKDERATDLIYLPWNRQEEATFFYAKSPQLVGAPAGWAPLPKDDLKPDALDDPIPAVVDVRESLSAEQRVSVIEHTIDPGFVNHRRIETILGDDGRQAINRAISALPPLPECQKKVRIDHIYSDIMLAFCRVLEVPPLGRLVAERKGRLFCSTEKLGPCRDIYKTERAVSRWQPVARPRTSVEFHYSMSMCLPILFDRNFGPEGLSRSLPSFTPRHQRARCSIPWSWVGPG